MGLGLIALLVTAIGEYIEGLKVEALRKTQALIDDAAKSAEKLADQAMGQGQAGPTYEVEKTYNHKQKKRSRLGKLGITTETARKELDKETKTQAGASRKGVVGEGRQGGKMEP